LAGTSYDRLRLLYLDEMGGMAIPMPKIFTIFTILSMISLALSGMSGFVTTKKKITSNFSPAKTKFDIQRLYGVIHNLATLQMTEDNITTYANKAQSAVTEFKLLVTDNDPKKMLEKLDNVCMVYVLHGLHENYESVIFFFERKKNNIYKEIMII
jgi:NADH:ubiquinone oxidoreductase subunit 4 (subunit M)